MRTPKRFAWATILVLGLGVASEARAAHLTLDDKQLNHSVEPNPNGPHLNAPTCSATADADADGNAAPDGRPGFREVYGFAAVGTNDISCNSSASGTGSWQLRFVLQPDKGEAVGQHRILCSQGPFTQPPAAT